MVNSRTPRSTVVTLPPKGGMQIPVLDGPRKKISKRAESFEMQMGPPHIDLSPALPIGEDRRWKESVNMTPKRKEGTL